MMFNKLELSWELTAKGVEGEAAALPTSGTLLCHGITITTEP